MFFVIHSLKLREKKFVFSLSARLFSFEMMKMFPECLVNRKKNRDRTHKEIKTCFQKKSKYQYLLHCNV